MSEEAKGLSKPVKLKAELSAMLGKKELPRTEITKMLWDHIKAKGLQTSKAGGKAEGKGKFIVLDAVLVSVVKNTVSTSKSGKKTDLSKVKEGDTIDMMQIASVVSCNIE